MIPQDTDPCAYLVGPNAAKVMKRTIVRRLEAELEATGDLHHAQFGFRKG